ncbi:unnamed protein product, partial [Amoebophrya sp. A120]|eukprot:GSA120T00018191001.1
MWIFFLVVFAFFAILLLCFPCAKCLTRKWFRKKALLLEAEQQSKANSGRSSIKSCNTSCSRGELGGKVDFSGEDPQGRSGATRTRSQDLQQRNPRNEGAADHPPRGGSRPSGGKPKPGSNHHHELLGSNPDEEKLRIRLLSNSSSGVERPDQGVENNINKKHDVDHDHDADARQSQEECKHQDEDHSHQLSSRSGSKNEIARRIQAANKDDSSETESGNKNQQYYGDANLTDQRLFALRRLGVAFFIVGGTQNLVANIRSPLFQEFADPRQEPVAKLHTFWVSMLFNIAYGLTAHFWSPKAVATIMPTIFGCHMIGTAIYFS